MRTRIRLSLAGVVLAIALAGGVAYATIPEASGVINGCYRTSLDDQKGQLRVVDDPASCRSNETPISWNQEGPQGTQGLQGIQGLKGDPGQQGIQGLQGLKGDTGETGPEGPKGDKGETGTAGANGTNGLDGEDGQPGANGTNGVDGAPGANGTNGTDGVSVTSAVEAAGANCANGGSKFTAANANVTYACNGSVAGTAGTAGFSSASASLHFGVPVAGVTVGTLSLSAGRYLLFAKVQAFNTDSTAVSVSCVLRVGTSVVDQGRAVLTSGGSGAVIPLMASAALPSAADVNVGCGGNPAGIAGVGGTGTKISALLLETLNGS